MPGLGAQLVAEVRAAVVFLESYPEGARVLAGTIRGKALLCFPHTLLLSLRRTKSSFSPPHINAKTSKNGYASREIGAGRPTRRSTGLRAARCGIAGVSISRAARSG